MSEEKKVVLEVAPAIRKLTWKQKLKLVFQMLKKLPYKFYWLAFFIISALLFSWWDELLVLGFGVTWNWLIIPIYYIIEYAVMLPLALILAKKTYKKLNLPITMREALIQSLKNSLPVRIYQKLRKRSAIKEN